MTPEQRYLFDLQGFLLVEDVLTAGELAELNRCLDEYDLWQNKGTGRFDELWSNDPNFVTVGPVHLWDEPFRQLLDHPSVLPYLVELLGEDFRYDHGHALLMRRGSQSLRLHGGGAPYEPSCSYAFRDGRMHNGLIAVSYTLTEALPGQGGFAGVPGSHKANLPCPKELLQFEKTGPWVVHVPAKPGSAILFSEALTHGTWPWTAEHERRSLLYKYTPGHMAYAGPGGQDARSWNPQALVGGSFTERQRRLLEGPYRAGRKSVE